MNEVLCIGYCYGSILQVFCNKPQEVICFFFFSIVMNADETKFDATTSIPFTSNILRVQSVITSLTT